MPPSAPSSPEPSCVSKLEACAQSHRPSRFPGLRVQHFCSWFQCRVEGFWVLWLGESFTIRVRQTSISHYHPCPGCHNFQIVFSKAFVIMHKCLSCLKMLRPEYLKSNALLDLPVQGACSMGSRVELMCLERTICIFPPQGFRFQYYKSFCVAGSCFLVVLCGYAMGS